MLSGYGQVTWQDSTALVSFWMAFEYLSLHSMYLSPWVNLGNGLSKEIQLIQWYEATGVAGGTLWILLSNLFLTIFIVNLPDRSRFSRLYLMIWLSIIIVPSAISLLRYYTVDQSESGENEVVIIQPNIDPFTEKYVIPFEEQLSTVVDMAGQTVTDKTDWVLTPETTVDDPVNEDDLENNKYISTIRKFACEYPGINIISGFVSLPDLFR